MMTMIKSDINKYSDINMILIRKKLMPGNQETTMIGTRFLSLRQDSTFFQILSGNIEKYGTISNLF